MDADAFAPDTLKEDKLDAPLQRRMQPSAISQSTYVHDRRGSNRRSFLCYQESSRGVVLAGAYLTELSQHQIGDLIAIEFLKLASQNRFTHLEGL